MSEWFETLDGLHARLWSLLVRGVRDRRAPARHVVLATLGADGWPEARTVVLRGAMPEEARLEVHTDLHSTKVASLAHLPRATVQVWHPGDRLQIRARVDVTVLSGAAVAETWARVPDPSRQSYGVTPPPGTPIDDALAYRKVPDHGSFAVLRCDIRSLDALHLGEVHRRAAFDRADGWAGRWLSP